jgi:Flp pilus assembly protein TadD
MARCSFFHYQATKLSVLFGVILCLVITISDAVAYKFGDFPGKGNKQIWLRANSRLNAGLHLSRDGKFDAAMPKILDAMRLYPDDPSYSYSLAICFERRNKPGDMEMAERLYRESIKLNSQQWETWNGLATPLIELHKYGEAKNALLTCLRLGPPVDEVKKIKSDIQQIDKKLSSMKITR